MLTLVEADARLKEAMVECAMLNEQGIQIGRKKYTTVATRVEVFRKHFGIFGRFRTQERKINDDVVQMKAYIELPIEGEGWTVVAEGDAEEMRAASQINRTSAVENCATSAIGRALAALGIHGGEFASANEVEQAIHQQANPIPAPLTDEEIAAAHAKLNACTTLDALGEAFLSMNAAEKKACSALKDALKLRLSASPSSEPMNGSDSAKESSPPPASGKRRGSPPAPAPSSGEG